MSTHGLSPAQMADALRDEAKHELPTAEGRALADLSAQLQAARAEVEALEEERDAAIAATDAALVRMSEERGIMDLNVRAAEARATQAEQRVQELTHPRTQVANLCSWCEQPYTDVTSLWPTPEDNERIKADARQHFMTCSAHPAVAAKEQAEQDKLELMRAFGAISLAVAAIDKGSDNTPWPDVVARIERIGACWDEGLRQSVAEAHLRQQAEQALATGWDAETVKRQVADFNGVVDALAEARQAFSACARDRERVIQQLAAKEQALADCRRALADVLAYTDGLNVCGQHMPIACTDANTCGWSLVLLAARAALTPGAPR